jgi:predicted MPP superfamily phosphohydrolase
MAHSFDSVPEHDPFIKSIFHRVLVAFAAPGRWPGWVVVLLAGLLAAGTAAVWLWRGASPTDTLLVFLIVGSFFLADRDLLASLPRRRISYGPWQSQFFALALPRAAVVLALGLLLPWLGWRVAFYLNIAIQFVGTIALYRGAIVEPRDLSLTELTVAVDGLPPGAPPLRLLHVSDLHVERLGRREEQLLSLIDAARPDVILLTGDYVNLSFNVDPATHAQLRDLLGKLAAPYGVFAVLGCPSVDLPDVVAPLFEGLPIHLLRDEQHRLIGPAGQALTIIGLECRQGMTADGARLARLLATISTGEPRLLLYHTPELMPQAVEHGIELYLCGHTHGGQVRLPLIGPLLTSSRLGRRYVMGHYHEGRTHLYVSRGIGFEGLGAPRVRLFCRPEVALLELVSY